MSARTKRIVFWGFLAVIIFAGIMWIVFPQYGDYTPGAKIAEVLLATHRAREQIADFHQKHKRFPPDASEVDLSVSSSGKIREMTYDGTKGELRAVIQNIPEVNGKTLILTADIQGGKLEWRCSNDGIPKDFLNFLSRFCKKT